MSAADPHVARIAPAAPPTDRSGEASFEDLLRVAAHVCEVPIACVTAVGPDMVDIVARIGIRATSFPREGSFCAAVVRRDHAVVVEDTLLDPEFALHTLVRDEPHARFYAGTPLHSIDGVPIGTLCVVDRHPRQLSTQQRDVLRALGRQAEALIALRGALELAACTRAEMELERDRVGRVLDAITQGVVVHASDASIVMSNVSAERILGLDGEQMRGRTPIDPRWQTIHRDGTPFPGNEHPASVSLGRGIEVRDVTMGVMRPDGERRWMLVNSAPIPAPGSDEVEVVATFSDITELTELNDQLHESLRELAEAAQERAALLSSVSHDIRAPLASIRMMTEILEDRADAITAAQRAELVHRVRVEARRTEGVLNDLVSANRVGAGLNAPRRQRVDLDELVRSATRDFSNDDHEVRLGDVHGDLRLWADRAQIERILDNLISNAIRHTPAGSRIVVSALERDGSIELAVDDDGPGVPAQLRRSIFEPYVRGERSADRPGSGLGLYLVQQFSEFHGGRAWCEDSSLGGSRFVVQLPRRER